MFSNWQFNTVSYCSKIVSSTLQQTSMNKQTISEAADKFTVYPWPSNSLLSLLKNILEQNQQNQQESIVQTVNQQETTRTAMKLSRHIFNKCFSSTLDMAMTTSHHEEHFKNLNTRKGSFLLLELLTFVKIFEFYLVTYPSNFLWRNQPIKMTLQKKQIKGEKLGRRKGMPTYPGRKIQIIIFHMYNIPHWKPMSRAYIRQIPHNTTHPFVFVSPRADLRNINSQLQ